MIWPSRTMFFSRMATGSIPQPVGQLADRTFDRENALRRAVAAVGARGLHIGVHPRHMRSGTPRGCPCTAGWICVRTGRPWSARARRKRRCWTGCIRRSRGSRRPGSRPRAHGPPSHAAASPRSGIPRGCRSSWRACRSSTSRARDRPRPRPSAWRRSRRRCAA